MPKKRGEPPNPKNPDYVAVGRRLRGIMDEWGVGSVNDLANLLGEERNRVSNWLNGAHPPPLPMALRIKAAFPQITLDWLYCGNHETLQGWLGPRLLARFEGRPIPAAIVNPSLPPGAAHRIPEAESAPILVSPKLRRRAPAKRPPAPKSSATAVKPRPQT